MTARPVVIFLVFVLAACGSGGHVQGRLEGLDAQKRGSVPGPGGCGVEDAYLVRSAAGVRLSQPALLTREAAAALEGWLRERAIPLIGRRGGGLAGITVPAHYACRTRNSRSGARLSEHARGRAIDISGFVLADGSRISVLDGWSRDEGRLLKRLQASACGPFGTVLGPEADRHHRDHLHFDVAEYRSGPYCR